MSKQAQPTENQAKIALVELTPGKVALCARKEGDSFYVLKEDMEPAEGVKLLMDFLSGHANTDELTDHEWRLVNLSEEQWSSREQLTLPPVKDWPKHAR